MIVVGASPMPLLRRCLDTIRAPVFQGYGMTEAAVVVTMLGLDEHRDLARPERLRSAGMPNTGVELAIVDPVDGRVLGAGRMAVGEPDPDRSARSGREVLDALSDVSTIGFGIPFADAVFGR
jgi:acyl-CoA synthetase (AMP-forming)/AMP-acid ligase II